MHLSPSHATFIAAYSFRVSIARERRRLPLIVQAVIAKRRSP
jgi:hypothetical protein